MFIPVKASSVFHGLPISFQTYLTATGYLPLSAEKRYAADSPTRQGNSDRVFSVWKTDTTAESQSVISLDGTDWSFYTEVFSTSKQTGI
jgi:hypothetical protein